MEVHFEAVGEQGRQGVEIREPCPHLGLREDPETYAYFPTRANYCHWIQPPAPVQPNYQREYCLTQWHTSCSVYCEEEKVRLSYSDLRLEQFGSRLADVGWQQALKIVVLVAFLVIVGILLPLGLSSRVLPITEGGKGQDFRQEPGAGDEGSLPLAFGDLPTSAPTAQVPATPESGPVSEEDAAIETGPSVESNPPTATLAPTPTATTQPTSTRPSPTATPCRRRDGWVTYMVARGQTLYSIALRYGLSHSDLQAANCLAMTRIYAGQVLYVPYDAPQAQPTRSELSNATLAFQLSPASGLSPTATAKLDKIEPPPSTATPQPSPTAPQPVTTVSPPTATPPIPGTSD